MLVVLAAAKADPKIKEAMTEGAQEAEEDVEPLFQFRNYGQPLPAQLEHDLQLGCVWHRLLHAHRGSLASRRNR